jgi:hypothetical protein
MQCTIKYTINLSNYFFDILAFTFKKIFELGCSLFGGCLFDTSDDGGL